LTQPEIAVVVGATGAVGSAVVARFTARGLPVVAVARGEAQLAELAATSELITPCAADIADNASIARIEAQLTGPVKIAVMAAGLPVRGSADSIDPDLLAVGANIKLGGLVRLLHAVRGRLDRGSRFVAFAGTLGLEPRAHEAGPGAINAGVLNLMRQISLLYGPRGITVHTICPGPADTPRLRRIVAAVAEERGEAFDDVWRGYADRTSLGRLPAIEEIAWAVTLLLEPEADIMHGGVLNLDGGGLSGIY
jgi:NAD(P)-dependent dehydrogenase (short-subunit alcohol dehydrogenase family)